MSFLPDITVVTKTCPGAKPRPAHTEPVSAFAADKNRPDGLFVYCRKCAAQKQREWRERNPDKVRAARLKYRTRASEQENA
jgi:hypothetical protein